MVQSGLLAHKWCRTGRALPFLLKCPGVSTNLQFLSLVLKIPSSPILVSEYVPLAQKTFAKKCLCFGSPSVSWVLCASLASFRCNAWFWGRFIKASMGVSIDPKGTCELCVGAQGRKWRLMRLLGSFAEHFFLGNSSLKAEI